MTQFHKASILSVPKFIITTSMNLGQGNIFRSMSQEFHPQGDMHGGRYAWQGACVAGGTCVVGGVHGRGHAWQGVCVAGGMHGRGTCMAGCAWYMVNEQAVRILLEYILVELKVVVTFHNEARNPDDFDSFHFMIL